jgi:branched-chain amino acid transport system permease protein
MSATTLVFIQFTIVYILLTWAFYLPMKGGTLYAGPIYSMAIGGYFAAFMVREVGWPLWLAFITAIILGAVVGFIPALGLARTKGIAAGMASIALVFMIQSVVRNLEFLGGSVGFYMPQVEYVHILSYVALVVVGVFVYRLERSRIGRALEAVLEDPDLAANMGINMIRINITVLTLSTMIGALAGVLFAFNLGAIYPDSFGFKLMLYATTVLFVGGRYTMWGAIIAAPILFGLPQWLPQTLAQYSNIIYGALLVVVLLMRPQGVITRGVLRRISLSKLRRR